MLFMKMTPLLAVHDAHITLHSKHKKTQLNNHYNFCWKAMIKMTLRILLNGDGAYTHCSVGEKLDEKLGISGFHDTDFCHLVEGWTST